MSLGNHICFFAIRVLTFPVTFLSYKQLHAMGEYLGRAAFYLLPSFRKRTLSNLSLASDLKLDEETLIKYAKESFENLVITFLEYPKLWKEKDIHNVAHCENPEEAARLVKDGTGVIFFCAHQANWEVPFLEGTSRMPGAAIGRPIKNKVLYDWVVSIRQKNGGKIIAKDNAIREGLRVLKSGAFLGIVGDQGMPNSGFSSPFFGRTAWTSPMPAILSYRTNTPILVAMTRREKGRYITSYSPPICPDPTAPMDKEIDRMMREALRILEQSILKAPGQWLWLHNRWKQQTRDKLRRRFRQEAIAIILPQDSQEFGRLAPHIKTFREIYPLEFITLFVPKGYIPPVNDMEIMFYDSNKDLLTRDYRFKLVFNFTDFSNVRSHFLSLSAFDVVSLSDLKKLSSAKASDLSELLKEVICNAH